MQDDKRKISEDKKTASNDDDNITQIITDSTDPNRVGVPYPTPQNAEKTLSRSGAGLNQGEPSGDEDLQITQMITTPPDNATGSNEERTQIVSPGAADNTMGHLDDPDEATVFMGNNDDPSSDQGDDQATRIANPEPSIEPADDEQATVLAPQMGQEQQTKARSIDAQKDTDSVPASTTSQPEAQHDAERTMMQNSRSDAKESTSGRNDTKKTPNLGQTRILNNRFILEKELGRGGMGEVYKAKDQRKAEAKDRNPYVAVKVLNENFSKHPQAFISLQREAAKTQKIAHPNIMPVYDFDKEQKSGIVFMTMELMEGDPLDQLLRKNPDGLEPSLAYSIARDICSALNYAHSNNIIHSDFKPNNVFVNNQNIAKVFDFGIARAANVSEGDGVHQEGPAGETTVFDAGTLGALTPAYASLEMLNGETPAVQDDIYALGIVIYQLFTGEHPYDKYQANQAQKKGLKPKRIDILKRRQWRALEKALAFERADRIATVDELFEAFFSDKNNWLTPSIAAMTLVLAISYFTYDQFFRPEVPQNDPEAIQRLETARSITGGLDAQKTTIEKAILTPEFSNIWELSLKRDFNNIKDAFQKANIDLPDEFKLKDEEKAWIPDTEQKIIQLYLEKITEFKNNVELDRAYQLLDNVKNWYQIDDKQYNPEKNGLFKAYKNRVDELLAINKFNAQFEVDLLNYHSAALKKLPQNDSWRMTSNNAIIDVYVKEINAQVTSDQLEQAEELLQRLEERYTLEQEIAALVKEDIINQFKRRVESELNDAFNRSWQNTIDARLAQVEQRIQSDDTWLLTTKTAISNRYIKEVERLKSTNNEASLNQALVLLNKNNQYNVNTGKARSLSQTIEAQIKKINQSKGLNPELQFTQLYEEFEGLFDRSKCRSIKVNSFTESLDIVKRLKAIDSIYAGRKGEIARVLRTCITRATRSNPEGAEQMLQASIGVIGSDAFGDDVVIEKVKIDNCPIRYAGTKNDCRDDLKSRGRGPKLVVIPSATNVAPFAVSQSEVTVRDFNLFCRITRACSPKTEDPGQPVTNISITDAKRYLQWLSQETDQVYRLPTQREWLHAANANGAPQVEDINCLFEQRGIRKGFKMETADSGPDNAWGLKRHLGNAQEWVVDGSSIKVMGGAYPEKLSNCTVDNIKDDDGKGNNITGFRVVREYSK